MIFIRALRLPAAALAATPEPAIIAEDDESGDIDK